MADASQGYFAVLRRQGNGVSKATVGFCQVVLSIFTTLGRERFRRRCAQPNRVRMARCRSVRAIAENSMPCFLVEQFTESGPTAPIVVGGAYRLSKDAFGL